MQSSAKRSRNPEKTRAHILAVAHAEVYRHGFQGVSVDRIIKKTRVTKGAFFHYFETKNHLGYALVEEVLQEMILERWIRPLTAYKNPVQGILRRFKVLSEGVDVNVACGCPLNNLSQEMSAVDPVFGQKIRAVMQVWIGETEKYLRLGRANGYLKKSVDTRQLAEFIVLVQEGAFAMAKATSDRRLISSGYNSLKTYLEGLQ